MTEPVAVGLPSEPLGADVEQNVEAWTRMGYRSVWAGEVAGPDFASLLGAVGVLGRRFGGLELGVGVAPVQTRAPWLLAATAASLASISGRPFNLGIGASSKVIVGDWSGADADRGLTRVRESVQIIRQALDGERTHVDGATTTSHRYRLPWRPEQDVRVLVGATGPRSLRQAGRVADGIVLTNVAPEHLPVVLSDMRAGEQERSEQTPRAVAVMAYCVVTDRVEETIEESRKTFLPYVVSEAYSGLLTRLGFGADVERALELSGAGRRDEARAALSHELLHALAAVGSAHDVAARVRAYLDAGADTVAVYPLGGDRGTYLDTWQAGAQALE
jgi:probable F420-dependent oxidoreductase